MTITWLSLISISAILGACVAIYKYVSSVVRWFDRLKELDKEILELKKSIPLRFIEMENSLNSRITQQNESLNELLDYFRDEISEIKEELAILTIGVLACLKGLAELGCDGPVHKAIEDLESHLNLKAHK